MGQAKQRGTFEERRAKVIDRRAKEIALQQELMRRRPDELMNYVLINYRRK